MEDKTIIGLLRSDPPEGLRRLIAKYRPTAAAIIARALPCSLDAEECVQDTFVAVWRNAAALDEAGSLRGYVAVTARNMALTRLRKADGPSVSLDAPGAPELSDERDVLDTLVSREDAARVQRAVVRLGEPERELLIRHYWLFERVGELAQRFGLRESQVKGQLYRGRQKLKKMLLEEDEHGRA